MIIISRGRGAGKTTEVARLVRERNGILVVANQRLAEGIRRQFDLRADQVVTFDNVRRDSLRGVDRERPVYIDDADTLLEDMLHMRIEGVTMSNTRGDRRPLGARDFMAEYAQIAPAPAPFIGIDPALGPDLTAELRPTPPRPTPLAGPTDDPMENRT